jgi:hypothetical protein
VVAMPYSPPSGWVETRSLADDSDAPVHVRFHTRSDCPRIGDAGSLRQVDKPYSAARCALCASELHEPTSFSLPAWAGPALAD